MHAVQFRRPRAAMMIAMLVLALGAALAFALLSGSTRSAQAAVSKHRAHQVRHEAVGPDTDNVQSGDQTTPDGSGAARAGSDTPGSTDPGNVQSGDQTTPDTGAAPGDSTGGGENSGDVPGDQQPAGGGTGADSQGDCQGNCVQ